MVRAKPLLNVLIMSQELLHVDLNQVPPRDVKPTLLVQLVKTTLQLLVPALPHQPLVPPQALLHASGALLALT